MGLTANLSKLLTNEETDSASGGRAGFAGVVGAFIGPWCSVRKLQPTVSSTTSRRDMSSDLGKL
ncbi:hypothetical protein GCM10027203_61760 [Nonomuraea fastidiosa]